MGSSSSLSSWDLSIQYSLRACVRFSSVSCWIPSHLIMNLPGVSGIFDLILGMRPLGDFLSIAVASNYLLSTGESYGLTVQHMQDSPIFFIQLNYVHKNKVLPPYVKFTCHEVAQHWEFHFLFFNPAILHSCTFGNSCSSLTLNIHQLFLLDCVGLYL